MNEVPEASAKRRIGVATPDFLLLVCGQWVSQLGDGMYIIALPLFALATWGSGTAVGLVMAAALAPFTLLSPFAGAYADRWNRRLVIILADVARGVVTLGVAYLAWVGAMTIPLLVAATALVSVASAFFFPSIMASIPNMVGKSELPRAVSLMEMGRNLARVLGPAIGGLLIVAFGFPLIFLINGISFLVSALSESFIHIPQATRDKAVSIVEDFRQGVGYLRKDQLLLGLMVVIGIMNLFEPALLPVLMPIAAMRVLLVGEVGFGYMRASAALGGAVAMVLLVLAKKMSRKPHILIGSLAGIGVCFLLLGLSPRYYLTLGVLFTYGLLVGLADTLFMVLLMGYVSDQMRGRIIGIISAVAAGVMPISFLAAGAVADLVSIEPILLVSGVAMTLLAIKLYHVPRITDL